MLTAMTEDDWAIVLQVFRAVRSRRGDKGRDDRKFLEALHYFTVHNITWRALPAEFGHWNSIWKRFWRLSRVGIFEAFFDALATLSESAHLVQMFELHGGARPRLGRGEAVGKLKRFKRIALRCEKTARNYGSFVALALGLILIKSVHTA